MGSFRFFKVERAEGMLPNFEKSLVQIALNQSLSDSRYPKIQFQVPDPALMYVATPTSVKVSQKKTFLVPMRKKEDLCDFILVQLYSKMRNVKNGFWILDFGILLHVSFMTFLP